MTGWLALALLLVLATAMLRLLGVRGPLLQVALAALFLGAAGYALQGRPALPGAPRAERQAAEAVPLTELRHAFFGTFTAAERWLIISDSFTRRGKSEEAVGILRNAIGESPGDAQLWVGLGNALVDHARGLTPAAELAYARAAELAPGHPAPAFFRGLARARTGDRGGAIQLWSRLLANAPAEASWRPLVEDALAAVTPPVAPAARPGS
jgi:cytochrome c-type biogenesis protein CcmH